MDLGAARYCARMTASLYRGREIPERLRRHLTSLMSEPGPEPAVQQQQSTHDLIGIAAAARILGVTQRHVRRIAADLDGVRIDGRFWIFDRQVVVAYASAKAAARQRDSGG